MDALVKDIRTTFLKQSPKLKFNNFDTYMKDGDNLRILLIFYALVIIIENNEDSINKHMMHIINEYNDEKFDNNYIPVNFNDNMLLYLKYHLKGKVSDINDLTKKIKIHLPDYNPDNSDEVIHKTINKKLFVDL